MGSQRCSTGEGCFEDVEAGEFNNFRFLCRLCLHPHELLVSIAFRFLEILVVCVGTEHGKARWLGNPAEFPLGDAAPLHKQNSWNMSSDFQKKKR